MHTFLSGDLPHRVRVRPRHRKPTVQHARRVLRCLAARPHCLAHGRGSEQEHTRLRAVARRVWCGNGAHEGAEIRAVPLEGDVLPRRELCGVVGAEPDGEQAHGREVRALVSLREALWSRGGGKGEVVACLPVTRTCSRTGMIHSVL